MAQTILSAVNYASEVFGRVLGGQFTHKLELFNSLLQQAPDQIIEPTNGDYASVPQWDILSGHADRIVNGLTTTINPLTQIKHRFPWMEREKAWGADEIIKTIAGQDATIAIAEMIGEYVAGEMHYETMQMIKGIFADALAATHVYDDSGATITKEKLILAKKKLGDNANKLTEILMNSSVYSDALTSNLIGNYGLNDEINQSGTFQRILGMAPYVTDTLEAVAGVYPSLLGAKGSLLYKTRPRQNAAYNNTNRFKIGNLDVELYRNSTSNGGYDALIVRWSYCLAAPGVQYDDTGGINPTATTLATSTSWTKVQTDNKLIPIVEYLSK